jgi:acyl-coenzyme A synthetase/AMP-(fatty) acid ligase
MDRSLSMANITERAFAAYGEREVFVSDGPLDYLGFAQRRVTVGDVHRTVSKLAFLLVRAGLTRFDRVAIYKSNSLDYFLFSLAVMRAGGIAVPVHGGLNGSGFGRYAAFCGCQWVFTDPATFATLDMVDFPQIRTWILTRQPATRPAHCIVLESELQPDVPELAAARLNKLDDALIAHTSGTTSFPKGVLHSSHSLIRAIRAQLVLHPWPMGERVLMAAHQNHHIAFTGMLLALVSGAWVYVATDHNPRLLLSTLAQERANIFFAFPDIYQGLYREGLNRYDLSEMRFWMSGGDAMHEVHSRACVEQGRGLRLLGIPLRGSLFIELFGTSEVGSAALTKISSRYTRSYGRCVGKPTITGPKVKIADAHGRKLPAGEVGRLMVRGQTLFKGYWNAHELLHGVSVDGWWWTGDLARTDRRGRFYHLDRAIDAVESTSGLIASLPIEEELLKCDDVGEAAVVGLPHPRRGIVPVAVAHSLSGRLLDTAALLAQVNTVLEPRQQLAAVIDVGDPKGIPRGLTGKVLKQQLREHYADWFLKRGALVA